MNNDQPSDRSRLIGELVSRGIPAYEYHSGGGAVHVAVDLKNDPESGDLLQIATGSSMSACDLGMMGWRQDETWESSSWETNVSFESAVELFTRYWREREQLVVMFDSGQLDG